MTIYQRAIECIPEDSWNEIVTQWKREHPNYHEYIRLRGGDAAMLQEWASRLNYLHIPFTWTNSIPFLAAFGFGSYGDPEDINDLSLDGTDINPEITFLSLPKEFCIQSLSNLDRIQFYNNMVYYMDVPIPILAKMHELGKLFRK